MSPRRLFWVISLATVVVASLVFTRFALLTKQIPDQYKTEKKLRILTYASFVEQNSAGSYLLELFKKDCLCKVEVVSVIDSGLLLERLRMAAGPDVFDLVIGLDQILLEQSKDISWRQLNPDFVKPDAELAPYTTNSLIPYDWAPLTFLYRQSEVTPPPNLLNLLVADNTNKIALQDPRTSALGQQFLIWMLSTAGGLQDFERLLPQLKKEKLQITSSWTASYNAFRDKQTQFVFTYLTSLVFHWDVEKDKNYQALSFNMGHPFQIEYVGIPESAQNVDLAERMIHYMLSDEGQKIIMTRNFMLPVRRSVRAGTVYEQLPNLKLLETENVKRNISIIKNAQELWGKVF